MDENENLNREEDHNRQNEVARFNREVISGSSDNAQLHEDKVIRPENRAAGDSCSSSKTITYEAPINIFDYKIKSIKKKYQESHIPKEENKEDDYPIELNPFSKKDDYPTELNPFSREDDYPADKNPFEKECCPLVKTTSENNETEQVEINAEISSSATLSEKKEPAARRKSRKKFKAPHPPTMHPSSLRYESNSTVSNKKESVSLKSSAPDKKKCDSAAGEIPSSLKVPEIKSFNEACKSSLPVHENSECQKKHTKNRKIYKKRPAPKPPVISPEMPNKQCSSIHNKSNDKEKVIENNDKLKKFIEVENTGDNNNTSSPQEKDSYSANNLKVNTHPAVRTKSRKKYRAPVPPSTHPSSPDCETNSSAASKRQYISPAELSPNTQKCSSQLTATTSEIQSPLKVPEIESSKEDNNSKSPTHKNSSTQEKQLKKRKSSKKRRAPSPPNTPTEEPNKASTSRANENCINASPNITEEPRTPHRIHRPAPSIPELTSANRNVSDIFECVLFFIYT